MPQFPLTDVGAGVGVGVGVGVGMGVGVGVGVGAGVGIGGGADTDAAQLAVVPPLEPLQLHVHGPEPATGDDVQVKQRLVVGATDTVVPFADPHAPLTAPAVTTTVLLAEDVPPVPVQVSV